jgi:hypothetical protein
VADGVWYLAICPQCNGGLNAVLAHSEQFAPMPFDDRDNRTSWVDAHMEGTGHAMLLLDQHPSTTNDATTHDDQESTVHQTE